VHDLHAEVYHEKTPDRQQVLERFSCLSSRHERGTIDFLIVVNCLTEGDELVVLPMSTAPISVACCQATTIPWFRLLRFMTRSAASKSLPSLLAAQLGFCDPR
jgi:hypothetical protein